MWPLRQNVQYNKQYFFKDIFLFVFAIHLILLGVLFLCESGKFHQERFVIDTKSLQSTVVFMPLQKRVPESKVGAAGSKNNGARKVMSHDEYQKKLAMKKKSKKVKKSVSKKALQQKQLVKPVEKKVVQLVEKKEPVKKSPTMLQTSSLAAKKKVQADAAAKALKDKIAKEKAAALAKASADKAKKALAIKEQQKLADKMKADKEKIKAAADKDKKLADQKTLEEKNKKIDKIEPVIEKQVEIVHEIPEQIIAAKIEPAIEKLASQVVEQDLSDDNSLSAASAQEDEGDDEDDLDNISFVGSRDLEMMHIKEQIQAEIVKYYKPPVGISKKAVCELSALVGPGGKATRVVVKKGSGSMANDVCARAALLKVAFPKEVIGREITIALGQ